MIKTWSDSDPCDTRCHKMSQDVTRTDGHALAPDRDKAWGTCTASHDDSAHISRYKCEVFANVALLCLHLFASTGHVAAILQVETMLQVSTMYCMYVLITTACTASTCTFSGVNAVHVQTFQRK